MSGLTTSLVRGLLITLSGFFVIFFTHTWIEAAPQGPRVLRGDVNIEGSGALTRIRASDGSIINFDSFNIGGGESVHFIQPNSHSRVLTRVIGNGGSRIDGQLTANGQLFLVNPMGIFFGSSAVVDVGGLFAAAGSLSNQDFIQGNHRFSGLKGLVENRGLIRASAVHLLGKNVANLGGIVADDGFVSMVSGDEVLIGESKGQIFVRVTPHERRGQAANGVGVENSGTIRAKNGRVSLAAGDIFATAIRSSGEIEAPQISLEGNGKALVEVSGTLDASSKEGAGGKIQVLGEKVGLYGATLDASGDSGGGTVLVGGDYKGEGEVRNAYATHVDEDSTIRADARSDGDGGKVVVWADGWTRFDGEVSAKGKGSEGGGGFVEVSGRESLYFRGSADLKGDNGQKGTLLLDPRDVTIVAGNGPDDGDLPDLRNVNHPIGDFTIGSLGIAALAADANLIVQATRDIIMSSFGGGVLTIPMGSDGSVVFEAQRDFIMNNLNDIITTAGAGFSVTARDIGIGTLNTNGGAVNLQARRDLLVRNVAGGSITLDADANNSGNGIIRTQGNLLATNGDLRIQHNLRLNGLGDQLLQATNGSLVTSFGSSVNKFSPGSVTLQGDEVILRGAVNNLGGSLHIPSEFRARRSLRASDGIFLDGNGTFLSNLDTQIINGGFGGIVAKGTLTNIGSAAVIFRGLFSPNQLNGDVSNSSANGGLVFEGPTFFGGDLLATGGFIETFFFPEGEIILEGSVLGEEPVIPDGPIGGFPFFVFTGSGNQTINIQNAETSFNGIYKPESDLSIVTNGTVVNRGSIIVESGDLALSGNLRNGGDVLALGDILLDGTLGFNEFGTSRVGSQQGQVHQVAGRIEKGLSLGPPNGPIIIGSPVLSLSEPIIPVELGSLEVSGGAGILLGGDVSTDMDVDLHFMDHVELTGGNQSITAGGELRVDGHFTKQSPGDLLLQARVMDFNGNLENLGGSIAFNADQVIVIEGNLRSNSHNPLHLAGSAPFILDGQGSQSIDAGPGALHISTDVDKVQGELILGGDQGVNVDHEIGFFDSTGSLRLKDNASFSVNQEVPMDFVAEGEVALTWLVDHLQATSGELRIEGKLSQAALGNIALSGGSGIFIGDNTFTFGDQTYNDPVSFTGGVSFVNCFGNLLFKDTVSFAGSGILVSEDMTFTKGIDRGGDLIFNNLGTARFLADIGILSNVGTGEGPSINLNGSGPTIFEGKLNLTGSVWQFQNAGRVTFRDDVNIAGGGVNSFFTHDTVFDGLTFTSPLGVTLGSTSQSTATLTGGPVIFNTSGGNGDFILNASLDGDQSFTVRAGSGNILMKGPQGNTAPLANMLLEGNNITLDGKATVTGDLHFDASGNLDINAPIDPATVTLNSLGDLTYSSPIVADERISLFAGGDLLQERGGSLTVNGPSGSIIGEYGGEAILNGDVSAGGEVVFFASPRGTGKFDHSNGRIQGGSVNIFSGDFIQALVSTPSLVATTLQGDVRILSSGGLDTTIAELSTGRGDVIFNFEGGGTHTFLLVETADGKIQLAGDGDIITNPDLSFGQKISTNGSGSVTLNTSNGGDIYIGYIEALDHFVSVSASGSIQDTQDDNMLDIRQFVDPDSPFQPLSLVAGKSIGGAALQGMIVDPEGDLEIYSERVRLGLGEGDVYINNLAGWPDTALNDNPANEQGASTQEIFRKIDRAQRAQFLSEFRQRNSQNFSALASAVNGPSFGAVGPAAMLLVVNRLTPATLAGAKQQLGNLIQNIEVAPGSSLAESLKALGDSPGLDRNTKIAIEMLKLGSTLDLPAFQEALQQIKPENMSQDSFDNLVQDMGEE